MCDGCLDFTMTIAVSIQVYNVASSCSADVLVNSRVVSTWRREEGIE